MITLYAFATPNCQKISIALEELGLAYEVELVDIRKNEQHAPDFLKISPNNKVPVIVDHDSQGEPMPLFESGAILTFLGEKTGRLLPPSGAARYRTLEWLHWQIGGLGPMFGQLGAFGVFMPEKLPAVIQRFRTEADRLLGVMERRLSQSAYLGGPDYSIADIAAFPWANITRGLLAELLGDTVASKPALRAWLDTIATRPAVLRGMAVPVVQPPRELGTH
ncbi:MAG TPA: glutathione S-transferase N-terminal domain-containing protein [Steroidobacteraceae bacterium]|nr:glutathione S-transferase N-terminal domain-containing protein [Steroidobacteraceae bacterium]